MSDILTGPDRGPPKFDWRDKAVKLQAEVDDLKRTRDLILMNMALALDGVPPEHRSQIVLDDKPAVLQSVMLTMAHLVGVISDERNRAQDAVVRGVKLAEALRAILAVVEGDVVTESEADALNKVCALADDALEEAMK